MSKRGTVLLVLIIFVFVMLSLTIYISFQSFSCLKYGYPDARITPSEIYCIRLVNYSQEVVPLSELEK